MFLLFKTPKYSIGYPIYTLFYNKLRIYTNLKLKGYPQEKLY